MTGRIVVGIDGSEGSRNALRWAIEEAQLRDAVVEAVSCWQVPAWFAMEGGGTDERERLAKAFAKDAASTLADTVGVELGSRSVRVEQRTVEGSASEELLDRAVGADLLVVGSRGLGGFKGLLLGSVSSQCLHHAPCPVVVIPPSTDDD
jgi:nucleotide-binding universal stress UspA family protein